MRRIRAENWLNVPYIPNSVTTPQRLSIIKKLSNTFSLILAEELSLQKQFFYYGLISVSKVNFPKNNRKNHEHSKIEIHS